MGSAEAGAETRPLGCDHFAFGRVGPHRQPIRILTPSATGAADASRLVADTTLDVPGTRFPAAPPPPRASASPAAKVNRSPLSVDPRGRDAGRNLGGSKGKRWRTPKAGRQPTILTAPGRLSASAKPRKQARDNARHGQTGPAAQTYFDVKSSDGRDRQRSVVYEGLRGQNEP